MSVHISARAWLVQGLTFAEKLVLLKLADMANDEGVCWPATATLGDQCGLDRRSVRRILARLEAAGHVHRKARFNEKGMNTSNWLTVLPPADRRAAVDPLPCRSAAADGGKGDRAVLPVEGDRSVLPPRTGRSSLGGTGRSSKPSLETSMKQAGRSDGSAVARQSRRSPRESGGASAAPRDAAAVVARLSPFQRSRVRSGQSALVDGQAVAANSAAMLELQAALRALEGGTAKRGGCSPAAAAALVGAVASAWESRKGAGDARA
jgi:hypothetical protein